MLEAFTDTTKNQTWSTAYRYDTDGRVLFRAEPSAVSSHDDTKADLFDEDLSTHRFGHLEDTGGLITYYSYYGPNDAAPGYLESVAIRNGETAALIPQSHYTYEGRTVGARTVYLSSTETVYVQNDGTEALTTSFAYTGASRVESIK